MLTPDDTSVLVPPVASPRKNKRVLNGYFNLLDFVIYIPMLAIALTIFFTCKLSFWTIFPILISFILVSFLLCFPLSFLGKDKPYIYIARWFRYIFGSHKNLVTEPEFNVTTEVKNTELVDKRDSKNSSKKLVSQPTNQKKPQDFISRMIEKKQKKGKNK